MSDQEKAVYLRDVVKKVYGLTGYLVPEELHKNSCGDHHIRWNLIGALCAKAMRDTEG